MVFPMHRRSCLHTTRSAAVSLAVARSDEAVANPPGRSYLSPMPEDPSGRLPGPRLHPACALVALCGFVVAACGGKAGDAEANPGGAGSVQISGAGGVAAGHGGTAGTGGQTDVGGAAGGAAAQGGSAGTGGQTTITSGTGGAAIRTVDGCLVSADPYCIRTCSERVNDVAAGNCVAGQWHCPAGMVDGNACPPNSCAMTYRTCCDPTTGIRTLPPCDPSGSLATCPATNKVDQPSCIPNGVDVAKIGRAHV
jgi:hypothetical protein